VYFPSLSGPNEADKATPKSDALKSAETDEEKCIFDKLLNIACSMDRATNIDDVTSPEIMEESYFIYCHCHAQLMSAKTILDKSSF